MMCVIVCSAYRDRARSALRACQYLGDTVLRPAGD